MLVLREKSAKFWVQNQHLRSFSVHYSAPLLSEIVILGFTCLLDAVFDQHKFFNRKFSEKKSP